MKVAMTPSTVKNSTKKIYKTSPPKGAKGKITTIDPDDEDRLDYPKDIQKPAHRLIYGRTLPTATKVALGLALVGAFHVVQVAATCGDYNL